MKIYVINLARAQDRRQRMEAQAAKFGLVFDYIEATDGTALTDADRARVDHKRRARLSKYPLSDNEIGCFISHRRAMQRLIDSGAPMATILEDDAGILEGFPEILAWIERCGVSFDFIDLHRLYRQGEQFRFCRSLFSRFEIGRIFWHMHGTGYIMTRAGAKKFLDFSERFAHVLDKEMHCYWANGLEVYGLNHPVIAVEDQGISYIEETRKQEQPLQRRSLPEAENFRFSLVRKIEKWRSSILRRAFFPAYVRRGQKIWAEIDVRTINCP